MKHHILRALIILVFLFSASYSYAAISYDLKISVYDAVKSQILQSLADDPSYSFLEDQHFQAISHICNDIPGRRDSETTNQYFNRNRYYSLALGRFTSKDPIGFNGGYNLYRYVNNNPLIYTDPYGFIGANQIHAMSFGSINNFFKSIDESPSNPKSATLYPVSKSNMSGAVVPIDEVCDCGPFMVQRVSAKLYDTVWDPKYSSKNPVTKTPFTGANVWKSFESVNPSDFYVLGNNIYFPSHMWDFITLRIILRCVPPS